MLWYRKVRPVTCGDFLSSHECCHFSFAYQRCSPSSSHFTRYRILESELVSRGLTHPAMLRALNLSPCSVVLAFGSLISNSGWRLRE